MLAKTIRTDVVPAHQRQRFLRSSMSALSFDCRIEPTGSEPLDTQMTAYVSEHFRLVKVAFTAHRTENIVASRTRRPADTFLVSLHQKGEIVVSQDGRTTRVGPQELFFIDTARTFVIDTPQMRCLSLYISGAQLRSVLPDVDQFTATAISAQSGAGAVFRTLLEQVYRNIRDLDDTSMRNIAGSIPYLLGAAFQARTTDVRVARPGSLEARIARVRGYVFENLSDPDLSCETVSRALSISVRQLHQLFDRETTTFMRWVWTERMKRCAADLLTQPDRPIGHIAFTWGFADLAHFSRSFKAAFGTSPRAYRRLTQP